MDYIEIFGILSLEPDEQSLPHAPVQHGAGRLPREIEPHVDARAKANPGPCDRTGMGPITSRKSR